MRRTSSLYVTPLLILLCMATVAYAAEPEAAEAAQEGGISLIEVVRWGGSIGYIIIFLSVITLMLVAYHIAALRRSKLWPEESYRKLKKLFQAKEFEAIEDHAQDDPSLLGRIFHGTFARMRAGQKDMEQAVKDSADEEVMHFQHTIGYFSLVAGIGPLFGLLGTVVGMIFAFNEIATRGVVTPKELAEPIQKALVTTCFGLIVAIPNVVAFTFFTNHLHKLMAELGMTLDKLVLRSRILGRVKESTGSSGKGSKDAKDASEAKKEK